MCPFVCLSYNILLLAWDYSTFFVQLQSSFKAVLALIMCSIRILLLSLLLETILTLKYYKYRDKEGLSLYLYIKKSVFYYLGNNQNLVFFSLFTIYEICIIVFRTFIWCKVDLTKINIIKYYLCVVISICLIYNKTCGKRMHDRFS